MSARTVPARQSAPGGGDRRDDRVVIRVRLVAGDLAELHAAADQVAAVLGVDGDGYGLYLDAELPHPPAPASPARTPVVSPVSTRVRRPTGTCSRTARVRASRGYRRGYCAGPGSPGMSFGPATGATPAALTCWRGRGSRGAGGGGRGGGRRRYASGRDGGCGPADRPAARAGSGAARRRGRADRAAGRWPVGGRRLRRTTPSSSPARPTPLLHDTLLAALPTVIADAAATAASAQVGVWAQDRTRTGATVRR